MKNKKIILFSLICIILIISIIFLIIYSYKSNKNKLYNQVFSNINRIYEKEEKVTDKDNYIDSFYKFYIKNNELKDLFDLYTYDKFLKNNKLENLYIDNNEIIKNIDNNTKKMEEIKNEILKYFTYNNFNSLIKKDKNYIKYKINNQQFNNNKEYIEKTYTKNIIFYNKLKEFSLNLIQNRDKWENNNNTIISEEDYKKYIDDKNKEFNINIITKKKVIPNNSKIPIFMYHAVNDETWGITSLFQKIKDFETEMKYLNDNGYKTIFLSDIKEYLNDKKIVILTFDDAYEDFYRIAYPIMKKYNIKSNLFVISNTNGGKYVTHEQIKELSNSGLVEIGSHTVNHPDLRNLNKEKLDVELKLSKETLEKLINKKVNTFAYPIGYHNDTIVNEASKYYEYGLLMGGGINYINTNTNYLKLKRVSMYRGASLEYFSKNVRNGN